MKKRFILFGVLSLIVFFTYGCAHTTDQLFPLRNTDEHGAKSVALPAPLEGEVLALNPDFITEKDITRVLSRCPAPRIINLDGSIPFVTMKSFSKFLILMGYPEERVRNPNNGALTYSSYMSSRRLAGLVAWHYESEGMMPIIIGHSQGGMLSVKVLYEFAGSFHRNIAVWNP